MREFLVGVALISCAVSGSPADLQHPSRPIGPWQVDFGDNRCLALRTYHTSVGESVIRFEPDVLGEGGEFAMIFRRGVGTDRSWGDIKVSWDGQPVIGKLGYGVYAAGSVERILIVSSPVNTWPAKDRTILNLQFTKAGEFQFDLDQWKKKAGCDAKMPDRGQSRSRD